MKEYLPVIILALTLLIIGGGAYYFYVDFNKPLNFLNPPTPGVGGFADADTEEGEKDVVVNGNTENPTADNLIPDLGRVWRINVVSESDKKILEDAKKIAGSLGGDSNLYDHWIALGTHLKILGDYEGALEAWQYAAYLDPDYAVAYNNMADLYARYLMDYKKAEENILKTIEIAPSFIYYYLAGYEFYRNVLKDDNRAEDLLKYGIDVNPGSSQGLQELLDRM